MNNLAMKKHKNKQNIISAAILVFGTILSVLILGSTPSRSQNSSLLNQKALQIVTIRSAVDSRELVSETEYPALVAGDQEITVSAKTSGTATAVNFNLGDRVKNGSLLVKIDDTGGVLSSGDSGFKNSQIQISELTVEQAEEVLEIAEDSYKNLKKQYDREKKDSNLSKTVSRVQLDAAAGQIEIAEIQLDSAKVGLQGTLNSHLVTSPISGTVIEKSVSQGDSIGIGQPLYSISQTNSIKFKFYVDRDQLTSIKKGLEISVIDRDRKKIPAVIRNISPQADAVTKRFLIEAYPAEKIDSQIFSGMIVRVTFPVIKKANQADWLIVPLSVITIGQNENYIYIVENNRAKKINVTVEKVEGEIAEIKTDLAPNSQIIFEGSKLVQDGEEVRYSL
jgi:RND family efflux transporter MFP subunit